MTRNLGMIALSIMLILEGLLHFGFAFSGEPTILAVLALAAGVLILLGR